MKKIKERIKKTLKKVKEWFQAKMKMTLTPVSLMKFLVGSLLAFFVTQLILIFFPKKKKLDIEIVEF